MAPTKGDMVSELQRMNQLLALVAIKGEKPPAAIALLYRAGYSYGEIGKLLDMSNDAVRMALTRGGGKPKAKKAANG